jgi:hypothetical protein
VRTICRIGSSAHSSTMCAVVDVLLAPYLRLPRGEMRIGTWVCSPSNALQRSDAASDLAFDQARGLLELYHRSRRVPEGYGVFLRRDRRRVGDTFTMRDIGVLRRVLLVALIDSNPSPVGGDDMLNAGHGLWTSDNVEIVGHRIQPDGYVSANYGWLTQVLVGGLQIGQEHSEIAPPTEVPFPMLGRLLDALYCDALWDVLRRDTAEVRRLIGAIDWFDLAWRNTPSTTYSMRILLLKSAFEVLLDAGHRLESQRAALSALLDRPGARRRIRRFETLGRAPVEAEMTDLEWWFSRLTFLRNAITHGEQPRPRDLRHGRHWHLWIAEYRMRQAIKEVVARHGYPLVRVSGLDRALMQALQQLEAPHG